MWSTPSSIARRSTAIEVSRSRATPPWNGRLPVSRIAPNPSRLTVRSPSCQVPAAPAGSALDGTAPLGGHGDRGVASRARLLLGQGAVGRAEPQREGQRLVAGLDLVAGVDVEEPDRLQVLPRSLAQGRLDLAPWSRGRPPPGRRPPWRPGTSRTRAPAPRRPRASSGGRGRSRRPPSGAAARTPRTRAGAARRRGRTRPRPAGPGRSGPGATASGWPRPPRPRRRARRPAGGPARSRPTSPPYARRPTSRPARAPRPARRPGAAAAPGSPRRAWRARRRWAASRRRRSARGRGRPGTPPCRSRTAPRPGCRGRGCGRRRGAGRAAASWCTTAPRSRAGWPAGPSCAARRLRAGRAGRRRPRRRTGS